MFRNLRDVEGYRLAAIDGEIGHVTDLYFDDAGWAVRYLVVATGSWLFGKKVLISPNAVVKVKFDDGCIQVDLSMDQVRNSPDIDTEKPISRQQESEYHLYYNFPPYWGGVALWGRYDQPGGAGSDAADEQAESSVADQTGPPSEAGEASKSRLRSAREVRGYRVVATDGQVGHVDNFLMEVENWAIRYLVVNTGGWINRHEVLLTPKLVDKVIWAEAQVDVNTSKRIIEEAPDYHRGEEIDRDYEERLFAHYTIHPYWSEEK